MERKYPHLFSPLKVAGVTLKNRIISAPMAFPDISPEGYLTPEAAAFYELRAKGGAAVVTVSECMVDTVYGKSHNINIALDMPNALPGLATTAAAIKRHGAIPCAELNHSGMHSGADNLDKSRNKLNKRFGPSACVLDNGSVIEEMPIEMIHDLVEKFGKGAALVKKAGFEMILLHAGHGWLLQQFLSPADNHRTDEYGGSLENRARLTLEILDAIRAEVGPKFPIEIRISSNEYREDGYGLDTALEFAKLVEPKVDLIQMSTGSHEGSFDKTHQPMFVPRGGLVQYAEAAKKVLTKPVSALGALSDPAMMDELIASGKCDTVEMARQLLADPYWPKKAYTGRDDEIVHCCRCFTCMGERMATGRRICSLNPVIGHEYELNFAQHPTTPKRVLVAGGGPAGLTCALVAAQRGHEVTLCEKRGELGGALRAEREIPFKSDLFAFVATRERQLRKAGVEIRLGTEVTPALCDEIKPDVLICAVGAEPIVPPLPGIGGENVVIANDLSEPETKVGGSAVILGGGLVGCEAAVHLAEEGRKVAIVEMQDRVCPDANGRHRPILLERMARDGVEIHTGMRGLRVTDEGLVCADAEGNEILYAADTVICSVGQRPLEAAADALRDCAPEVVNIGDCVRPGTATQANFRAYFAALDI